MNLAEMVYSLYVVVAVGFLAAGLVKGYERGRIWLASRWIKREIERAERERDAELRLWRRTW